jgi:hypothetical protein
MAVQGIEEGLNNINAVDALTRIFADDFVVFLGPHNPNIGENNLVAFRPLPFKSLPIHRSSIILSFGDRQHHKRHKRQKKLIIIKLSPSQAVGPTGL